jgi:hypothetical protein
MIPPPPWQKGPRKLVATIAWDCTVKEDNGQVHQLAGSFEIYTGPGQSFARFTKTEGVVFTGRRALQSDDKTWFLPDVSLPRSDAYYDAAFNFRTSLAQSDEGSGFVRLSVQELGSALREYARGPCSKRIIYKATTFERLLKRYGAR